MRISVIGTGYVGLVTGVVLAHLGNDVICVDKDQEKLAKIREGKCPIYEPGLEELVVRGIEDGFLHVSDSIVDSTRGSEVIFIAVGTPPAEDGTPDLSAVRAVAAEIAKGIDSYKVIVNKSTVPVGTGDLVSDIIRSHGVPDTLFDVVSNPEFLREGSAIRDTLEPDRIVIGSTRREAAVKMVELYSPLERPMFITDLKSAELIKYASNSFLAMKISFINAISRICELCGADIGDVAKGVGADARIGSNFLQAGLGWGGSCFPKDVTGLITTADRLGYDFDMLRAAYRVNDEQTSHFIDRLEDRIGGFKGKTLGILGLAFKPNTDDIRDAKSLYIIDRIQKCGGKVQAYDPVAGPNTIALFPGLSLKENPYEVARDAEALVVVTEWNEFRQLDLGRIAGLLKRPIIFDGRRIYDRTKVARANLEYHTIGSP
jgi:UDPglucose 6-dehydrogenase